MLRYLELDIRILADVFEEFRQMTLAQDGLEPVHFVSLPGLSFESAFKMTGETIHLLQEAKMYNLFERGIRGGLTFINKHHAKHELVQVGDKTMKNIILYIDQNNLYGAAMSEFLPHSDFQFLSSQEIQTLFPDQTHIINLDTEGDEGYLFEVDLHYPPHIHQTTSDFPLAPESIKVTEDMLSQHMKNLYKELQQKRNPHRATQPKFKSTYKLLMSQNDKKHYVIHFKLLQYFLNKGMELTKIHTVVKFTQKQFLKPYISYNSQKRAQAKTDFHKDYYKLKNNSLFGKTMEDVRKHSDYKLATTIEQHNRYTASPLFYTRNIITETLEGIHMYKPKVTLNKPIFIGQAVLDHSKLAMYTLFYNTLPSCPLIHDIRLLGGDTDSFFLQLTVEQHTTPGDILTSLKKYVDFSNYPPTHPLFSSENTARLGCFKDEVRGRTIDEIILLRPKMYSIKCDSLDSRGESTIKRAKGIGRSVVEHMGHEAYQQAYHNHTESTVNMTIIRSIQHTVHTITIQKRGLCCWDDKRVWISANESVPHGSVLSPVAYDGPVRVRPPVRGDVCSDDDNDDEVQPTVQRAVECAVERDAVVECEEEERGEAVGFDDEERSEDESERESDVEFIDDAEVCEDRPLRQRVRYRESDDESDDEGVIARLAKRCRFR